MTTAAPIQDTVGAALRFVRENVRFVATLALITAAGLTLLLAIGIYTQLGLLTGAAALIARAFIYAALIGAALTGAESVRGRIGADGWRVWAACAVVAFFMFIAMFVAFLPGMIVLGAGPLTPYVAELQVAGQDQAAVLEIMTRFAMENPIAVLLFFLFYSAIWLLLTSRLYLVAPASADQKRILTFETWRWTKGALFNITAARIMLLGPAYVLVNALDYVIATLPGVNMFDADAMVALAHSNPAAFFGYAFTTNFIGVLVYTSLEAGLSTQFYRALKPATTPQTTAQASTDSSP